MATQDNSRIPLTLAAEADRRHFRLLELPPELLTLLLAGKSPILELKASEALDTGEGGHIVLCTQDQTFDLRQKNSSNTVYLLEPHVQDDSPTPSLQAVAQCHSSLELSKSKIDRYEAWKLMRAVIPSLQQQSDTRRAPRSKQALFDQMQFHQSLCEQVFLDLGAYEDPDTGCIYKPEPSQAWETWKAVMTTADLRSIHLDAPFWLEDVVDEDSFPVNRITSAIVQSFSTIDATSGLTSIDKDGCVAWNGRAVLEHKAVENISLKEFLEQWKDLLPEQWRELADVAKLSSLSQISEDGKSIRFRDPSKGVSTDSSSSTAGKRRKWHEKFRPQKT